MKKIAISQSNYIPWKGFFGLIKQVDCFVFYDDMQFTKRDWRNRNLIKTPTGLQWLTIPVNHKSKFFQKIKDVEINSATWQEDHLKTIRQNYIKAPFFNEFYPTLKEWFLETKNFNLSRVNQFLTEKFMLYLEINTILRNSSEFTLTEDRNLRLISIVKQCGGDIYLSGPSAKAYMNLEIFEENGIKVEWMKYEGYPEYPQLYSNFDHGVSIVDLIFNLGKEAKKYII